MARLIALSVLAILVLGTHGCASTGSKPDGYQRAGQSIYDYDLNKYL